MDVVCLTYSVAYENSFFKVQRFVMVEMYSGNKNGNF